MSQVAKGTSFHASQTTKFTFNYMVQYRNATKVDYTFYNHFHPYVGELIARLNERSVDGLLDVDFHASLVEHYFASE